MLVFLVGSREAAAEDYEWQFSRDKNEPAFESFMKGALDWLSFQNVATN